MKNSFNYYHITMKNLFVLARDTEMLLHSNSKEKKGPCEIILVHK